MSQQCTTGCGRPSPAGSLCTGCYERLERDLASLPELLGELEVTLARQARIGGGKRGKGHSEPLPIDLGAMTTSDTVRLVLVAWVRTIIDDEQLTAWPADTLPAMALWLLGHIGWARRSDEAAQYADEISDVHRLLTRAVDRPEQRIYAGPCATGECQAQLYAHPGKDRIVCDGHHQDTEGCGAIQTTIARKRWLRESAEDYLAPLQVILDAIPTLTGRQHLPAKGTVRRWLARGRLVPHGLDRNGQELFRGGDVIDLVLDEAVRPGPKRRDLTKGKISA